MADQVLSQAAIDAMIAGGGEEEAQAEEALVEGLVAEVDAEATAEVAEVAEAAEAASAEPDGEAAATEPEEAEDPKARFKTFAVSASQETSENDQASGAAPVGSQTTDAPETPEPAPAAPAEPDPAMVARIQSLEERLAVATAGTEQLNQSFQALMGHVTAVTNAVNQMIHSLGATPGYGAGHSFVCSSCGDTGHLTIPLTCSNCGESTETGWWPEQ